MASLPDSDILPATHFQKAPTTPQRTQASAQIMGFGRRDILSTSIAFYGLASRIQLDELAMLAVTACTLEIKYRLYG
ncbi:hypothetical protein [uncultured Pseudodesulfovibrio sp.]|uniref:hypothetical protein n=1 Tax=uncultured Pseudodesulfovibrio sp. TaxID=2035858 RepID=UPI0029C72442|nr:hypothetical protein [uncultured Pseudodesulfovibrio sp.]